MPKESAPGPAKASATLSRLRANGDINLPAFRPLKDLAAVTDDDELRREMLARLDDIYRLATTRERTIGKDQRVIVDPDSNAACKVVEIASDILGVKVGKRTRGDAIDPSVFAPVKVEAS
jgi:hypothetical protein